MPHAINSRSYARSSGFTLIELMVATAIAGILAALAYPSLQGPILKARRTDAMTGLMQLHATQERWRADHDSYANLSELQHKDVSPLGYYQLSVTAVSVHGFEGLATAIGTQANDKPCQVMKITVEGGNTTYSSNPDSSVDNTSANLKRCWFQ